MPSFFTHYWQREKRAPTTPTLQCTQAFSSQFIERGVRAGDRVYFVSYAGKRPYLVGAITVAVDPEELEEGGERIDAVLGSGAVMDFNRPIPLGVARSIVRADTGLGLKFVSEDTLDPQTLRGVQRITPESARLLDAIIGYTGISYENDQALDNAFVVDKSALYPDEVSSTASFSEGTVQRVLVNRYERDPAARAACLAEYGHVCAVCEFDFGEWYGQLGEGFIHVHHVTPISEIGGEYRIDPIRDLVPVCPNCHAMLHRTSPPLTVKELFTIVCERNIKASVEKP